jgi:hypothetical protein
VAKDLDLVAFFIASFLFLVPAACFGAGGQGVGALGGQDGRNVASVRRFGQCSQMLA